MADRAPRRQYHRTSSNRSTSVETVVDTMGKPRSDVSPGGSKEPPEKKKVRPKRERWLLTRKTWRYMADAGRRLIPEGLQNRPEDVPKIEAYFQEVCQKEPRFLLWRKQSYPGALGFRSRGRSRGGRKKMGGSCRDKTSSADEAEDIKKGSVAGAGFTPQLTRKLGSRLDLKKLKEEFLLGSVGPLRPHSHSETRGSQLHSSQPQSTLSSPEEESDLFLETLEMYLKEKPTDPKSASTSNTAFNHEELLLKLREHLDSIERVAAEERARSSRSTSVHFEGDYMQKTLLETIRRHFGRSTNREKVISDMLTDRKSLERLYFDLRKTRGFKSGRKSGDSVRGVSFGGSYSSLKWRPPWRPSGSSSPLHYQDLQEEEGSDDEGSTDSRQISSDPSSPPPMIELELVRPPRSRKEKCYATQTEVVSDSVLEAIQEELKRLKIAKQEAEEKEAKEEQLKGRGYNRRSSVTDNDDVSPSVGDTIKRYLRMARKKSIDSDKADRFKRVNYDKNIRNIKAKGEITQIGDDDGLDKGCQTDETWVVALKELKLEDKLGETSTPCEEQSSSRITSSRSSVDTGVEDLSSPPQTPIPPTKSPSGILSTGQTFLSNLLHHQKSRNTSSSVSTVPGVMQKSKSSSSVVHQGSRLVAKTKIWKSRSKSQNRANPSATSAWTPQGNCQWSNVTGRTITISDTTLLQLSDIERRVLQKVALAKLQALNLGVAVRIPSESVGTTAVQKPKRRAYLLKRKAITTGFFDSKTGKDDKDKTDGGMVFGVPLGQCVENERLARCGKADPLLGDGSEELRRKSHHGSHSSFTSLIESATSTKDQKGSSESLMGATLSMPGMLDSLSVGSALDLSQQEQGGVPNIVLSCLRHLESYGLHTLGIFRVSSSKKRVRQLREDFDCGKEMLMERELCPHDVATLLKEYFRDLPDSLLCKDLYSAFIQTQRIRNRRLQSEALQHLLQLLPVPNRDTLWVLLCFLAQVAKNSEDHKDTEGEWVVGNKMDSNNLATLFAPNILHSCKPSGKDELSLERTEERSDAINVIRALIDNYRSLYQVSAELLDEVYVHMMDSHPEALDQIMQRRDLATEETEDLEASTLSEDRLRAPGDSQESLVSYSVEERIAERKVWSREAFTHETAGMGGPDLDIKIRKERGRERVNKKRWREDGAGGRRRLDSDQSTPSRRTSSISYPDDSGGPDDPMMFRGRTAESGVITASLKIPVPSSATTVIDDSDIPFIEDSERHQLTLGVVRSSQRVSSDSSQASTYVQVAQYHDSAVGSSVSPPHSYSSGGVFSSPPSWASSPPTSPDHTHTTVNYLPEEPHVTIPTKRTPDPQQRVTIQRVTIKSAGEVQQVKQSYSRQESSSSVLTQQEQARRRSSKDAPSPYQRLASGDNLAKSASVAAMGERTVSLVRESERTTERANTPSISSIGGDVLRSKTADIERMLKIQNTKQTKKSTGVNVSSEEEKKIKRKYTDSRHLTRTLPQTTEVTGEAESSRSGQQRPAVYKRREIISSEQKETRRFF